MMHLVTAVANARGTTEDRIVNDYTYRQLFHVGEVYLRDRLLVFDLIARSLKSMKPRAASSASKSALKNVVDIDSIDFDDKKEIDALRSQVMSMFSSRRK